MIEGTERRGIQLDYEISSNGGLKGLRGSSTYSPSSRVEISGTGGFKGPKRILPEHSELL